MSFYRKTYDLSVGSTVTKNLKLKTKKSKIFVNNISSFLYTLEKKTFFTLLFPCPPYSKCIKKLVEFSFTPAKNILVFSFQFLVSVDPTEISIISETGP